MGRSYCFVPFALMLVIIYCSIDSALSAASTEKCTVGDVRLVNGSTNFEGVVEICSSNKTFSTVCRNHLSCNVYKVLCRAAGFDTVITSSSNYTSYSIGNIPKLGFYKCKTGEEKSLSECTVEKSYCPTTTSHCGWGTLSLTCGKSSEQTCDKENDVQLYGGSRKSEGQLQVCRSKEWRDVCDGSYAQLIGYVVCKQLGYSSKVVATAHNGFFYNSTRQPYAYSSTYCYRQNVDYSSIASSCSVWDYNYCYGCLHKEVAIDCQPEKAGTCQHGDVRLFGGRDETEGWLEVCVDGMFGRAGGKIEGRAKELICTSLGFNETGSMVINYWTAHTHYKFGGGISPVLLKYINCCDRDKEFKTCDMHRLETDNFEALRKSIPDIAIGCTDGCKQNEVRLVGGKSKYEGTVETCVNGVWRAIGTEEFDDKDAVVVCKNFAPDQTFVAAIATDSSKFKPSKRFVVYDKFQCTGSETILNYCRKQYLSSVSPTRTRDTPTAAVRCRLNGDCPVCDSTGGTTTAPSGQYSYEDYYGGAV